MKSFFCIFCDLSNYYCYCNYCCRYNNKLINRLPFEVYQYVLQMFYVGVIVAKLFFILHILESYATQRIKFMCYH